MRLWREHTRVEQFARLNKLQIQTCDEAGFQAHEMARLIHRQLPEEARIDLPSPRVFSRILGLFRTCAQLKKGSIHRLELSAEEIAALVGYSRTTTESALRWLGCAPIIYKGNRYGEPLKIIHRGRRTAPAFVSGVFRFVYRTSRLVLTNAGRLLLGLGMRRAEGRKQKYREAAAATPKPPSPPQVPKEEVFIRGQSSDGGGDAPSALGRDAISKIKKDLGLT